MNIRKFYHWTRNKLERLEVEEEGGQEEKAPAKKPAAGKPGQKPVIPLHSGTSFANIHLRHMAEKRKKNARRTRPGKTSN